MSTFFDGYDFIAVSQILPEIREEWGFDEVGAGILIAVINFGTMISFALVAKADRWGRRRVMMVCIAGYTIGSFLTAFSPNVWTFAFFQFVASTRLDMARKSKCSEIMPLMCLLLVSSFNPSSCSIATTELTVLATVSVGDSA